MLHQKGKYFLTFTALFSGISVVLLLLFSKPEIAIAVNKFNSPFCDVFFKYITHGGTAYLLIPVFILLVILKKKKAALVTVFSAIFMLIITSTLKRSIYSERPSKYFEETFLTDYNFHFVEGVKLHVIHSFPSGHTATAFVTFFLATVYLSEKRPLLQIIFFFLAFFVAYSRMYLFQHFLIDVFAGVFFGIFSVFLANIFVSKTFKKIK